MGMFAFNKMRLKREEEMRPENIQKLAKKQPETKVEEKAAAAEKPVRKTRRK